MIVQPHKGILRERRVKLFFFLASIFLIFIALVKINNLLVSFMLAFVGYYLLAPGVDYLERRGFPRVFATAIPFFLVIGVALMSVEVLYPMASDQTQSLKMDLPKLQLASNEFLAQLETRISDLSKPVYPIEISGKIQNQLVLLAESFFRDLPYYVSQSVTILFLAPFLAFFMLLNGRDFVRKLLALVPNNIFELTLNLNYQIGFQMGGFIRARIIQSLLVGIFIWVGLLIMGFPIR